MPSHPLSQSDLLGSSEIRFMDRQESSYPHLMRMCLDFDFRVLQLLCKPITEHSGKHYVLSTRDYRSVEDAAITPQFATLAQLDAYVAQHQVDILHNYLFGFVEEDIASAALVETE